MDFHSVKFDSGAQPKFQTTQRKPGVIEALSKLWTKIQLLEKCQNIKQTQHSLGIQTDVKGTEDSLPTAEAQCKLLELQLRYLRRILAHSLNGSDTIGKNAPESSVNYPIIKENNKNSTNKDVPQNYETVTGVPNVPVTSCEQIADCAKCTANLTREYPIKLSSAAPAEEPKFVSRQCRTRPGNSNHPTVRYARSRGSINCHYHLNLKDIPFILGTSTTASHSVIANVQKIISMMKTHRSGLCTGNCSRQEQKIATTMGNANKNNCLSANVADTAPTLNINELINTLQDELDGLTLEEKKIKKHLSTVHDPVQEEALYHEQNALASRVESKMQQIETLRTLLVPLKKSKKKHHRRGLSADNHATKAIPSRALRRHRASSVKYVVARPASTLTSENKQLLQELNKLKTVLSQDDVCWT